jgi:hypothetical protein
VRDCRETSARDSPREESRDRIESERSFGDRLEEGGIVRLVQDEEKFGGQKSE